MGDCFSNTGEKLTGDWDNSGRRDIQYLQFHEDQNFPGIFFLLVEFKVIVGFPNIRVHNVYHETMREERSDGKDKMKNY